MSEEAARLGVCTASSWDMTARSPSYRSTPLQIRQRVEQLPNGVQQRPGRYRFHPIAQQAIAGLLSPRDPLRVHRGLQDETDRELPMLRRATQRVQELQAIVERIPRYQYQVNPLALNEGQGLCFITAGGDPLTARRFQGLAHKRQFPQDTVGNQIALQRHLHLTH